MRVKKKKKKKNGVFVQSLVVFGISMISYYDNVYYTYMQILKLFFLFTESQVVWQNGVSLPSLLNGTAIFKSILAIEYRTEALIIQL